MTITDLIERGLQVPINSLGDLAKEVQARLAVVGCLDPPADGVIGPVSKLAIRGFARAADIAFDDLINATYARALLDHTADSLFPLTLGNDFASRLIRYMHLKEFWFCRMPDFLTIVYVEGANEDGTSNPDVFNAFNDRRIVLTIRDGKPKILLNVLATTEPGRYYTIDRRLNPRGAARIAFGQYKAWTVGIHRAGAPGQHEALVQRAPIPVHRDLDANGLRTGDEIDVGVFGINQHSGFNADPNNIGRASAGCLVARSHEDHRAFMNLVKTDPRFNDASAAYQFMSTIIAADDLNARLT